MTTGHVEIDLASVDVGTTTNMPGVTIGVPGATGPKGDKGDTGAMGPAGDQNSSDSSALAHPAKDFQEPVFLGGTTTNRVGAVCIPFVLSATTTAMLTAEVDLVGYSPGGGGQFSRLMVESGCYFRPSASGGILSLAARCEYMSRRAALTPINPPRVRVRWIQETDVKLWLVIGDVADAWSSIQPIVRRVVATTGSKAWTGAIAGAPQFLTVLPTPSLFTQEATVLDGSGVYYGTGAPTISADPGAKYIDLAATTGAMEWTKMSGVVAAGWVVTNGDTGWRTITSWTSAGVVSGQPLSASWAPVAGNAGAIAIRRRNENVYVNVTTLSRLNTTVPSVWAAYSLPAGFRPDRIVTTTYAVTLAGAAAGLQMVTDGNVARATSAASGADGPCYNATVQGVTVDAWPTVLPGT